MNYDNYYVLFDFFSKLPEMSKYEIQRYCENKLQLLKGDFELDIVKIAIEARLQQLSFQHENVDNWLGIRLIPCKFADDYIEWYETENGYVYIKIGHKQATDVTHLVRAFVKMCQNECYKYFSEIRFLKKYMATTMKPFERNRTGFLELRDNLPKPLIFSLVAKQPKKINLKQFFKQHSLGTFSKSNPRYYFHKTYLEANFYRETEKNSGIFINELENL